MIKAWAQQWRRPVRSDEVPPWLLPWVRYRGLALLAAVAVLWWLGAMWVLNTQWARIAAIRQQMVALAAQPVPPAPALQPPQEDFTYQLPVRPDIAPLVGELQRAASSQGVAVLELQSRTAGATGQQLAQAELTAQMSGTYTAIKQVLWEVQSRYPHATVRRLSLRRNTSPQDIQAEVTLVLWGQPQRPAPNTDVPDAGGGR